MNWFERYGIVGNCVIAMISTYILGIFPNSDLPDEKMLIAGAAILFLPCGYVASMLSQAINLRRSRFNRDIVTFLRNVDRRVPVFMHEWEAEAWLAEIYTATLDGDNEESRRIISEWQRKRWDIIAISSAIRFVIYGYLAAASLTIFILFANAGCDLSFLDFWRTGILLLILVFVFSILTWNRRLITVQLRHFYEFTYPDIARTFRRRRAIMPHRRI